MRSPYLFKLNERWPFDQSLIGTRIKSLKTPTQWGTIININDKEMLIEWDDGKFSKPLLEWMNKPFLCLGNVYSLAKKDGNGYKIICTMPDQ